MYIKNNTMPRMAGVTTQKDTKGNLTHVTINFKKTQRSITPAGATWGSRIIQGVPGLYKRAVIQDLTLLDISVTGNIVGEREAKYFCWKL